MPACSREVLTGGLGCPRASDTRDEVILAKEMGIQLKQDATKIENRKVKGCKALQNGTKLTVVVENPRALPGPARQWGGGVTWWGPAKTRMLLGASSCSTTPMQPLAAAACAQASPEYLIYFIFFSL